MFYDDAVSETGGVSDDGWLRPDYPYENYPQDRYSDEEFGDRDLSWTGVPPPSATEGDQPSRSEHFAAGHGGHGAQGELAGQGGHGAQSGHGGQGVSPFQRLARVHAAAAATDAVIAVALAGSIFFSISPDAARERVALYLALTMAPFAVVAPLIGPVIDRMPGGRRIMIIITVVGRAVLALMMIGHINTLWLFPEAFALLVLQKSYSVAKSAVVPHYVPTESDLVQANSRLALLSAVMSLVGAVVGGALVWIGDPSWAAGAATIGYGLTTMLTLKLSLVEPRTSKITSVERAALRAGTILSAATAMAVLRCTVGFVTFLLAFELRGGTEGLDVRRLGSALGAAVAAARDIEVADYLDFVVGDPGAPPWHFGVVVAAAGLCAFGGVRLAPVLRREWSEETILGGALATGFAAAFVAGMSGGLLGMALVAAGVSIAAAAGKLAFDSLVQRDAPDADHGRSFAKFEARFQVAWVVGAFIPVALPVVIPLPARLGSFGVAALLGFALFSFLIAHRSQSKITD